MSSQVAIESKRWGWYWIKEHSTTKLRSRATVFPDQESAMNAFRNMMWPTNDQLIGCRLFPVNEQPYDYVHTLCEAHAVTPYGPAYTTLPK